MGDYWGEENIRFSSPGRIFGKIYRCLDVPGRLLVGERSIMGRENVS